MKIKLEHCVVNTNNIKQLYNKPHRLLNGRNKIIKPRYFAELYNGDCIIITKQEYKLLKARMDDKNEI